MGNKTTSAIDKALPGIGIATGLITTGLSFAEAAKQKKLQRQAQQDAEQAMAEARKKLEVNYMDALSIQKEPYELQREALLSQGAQAIQAGVESERGAAATAGRIQGQMNLAQQDVRTSMGKEMSDLEKLSAQEDSRLRDVRAQLDLEEAAGQQQMARDAEQARAAAITQGMGGLQNTIQQGIQNMELYGKDRSINPETGFAKGSTENLAAVQGLAGVQKPSTIGMVQGANRPMLMNRNVNAPLPQSPLIYPNQPAYNQNLYNPFAIGG